MKEAISEGKELWIFDETNYEEIDDLPLSTNYKARMKYLAKRDEIIYFPDIEDTSMIGRYEEEEDGQEEPQSIPSISIGFIPPSA